MWQGTIPHLVTSWKHWTTSIVEGVVLCSYWNRHSGYGFGFPTWDASAKTTILGLTECVTHYHGILTTLLLIKELTSQQKKCSNKPMIVESTCLTMLPPSKTSGLIEQWKDFLEIQLQGAIPCRARASLSRRLYMLLFSIRYMIIFLPELGFMGPGIEEWN